MISSFINFDKNNDTHYFDTIYVTIPQKHHATVAQKAEYKIYFCTQFTCTITHDILRKFYATEKHAHAYGNDIFSSLGEKGSCV